MANGAGGRKSRGDVIGIGSGGILRLVAGVAISGDCCVVVVDVTLGACGGEVGTGEGEGRLGMIEGRRDPAAGGVAHGAVRGESGCIVVGALRGFEIRHVARIAIAGGARKSVVDVALCTGDIDVHSSERIAGVGGVVELGSEPACGGVAHRAIVGQAGGKVRRVGGCDKVLLMAGKA